MSNQWDKKTFQSCFFFIIFILGQQYLAWAFSDLKEGDDDEEDAKARNKRIVVERTKALKVLNIKPSRFQCLYSGGKIKMLQELLEKSLTLRIEDSQERTEEEMKADFNINFEANMFCNMPFYFNY